MNLDIWTFNLCLPNTETFHSFATLNAIKIAKLLGAYDN